MPIAESKARELRNALILYSDMREANEILNKNASRVSANDIHRLFELGDQKLIEKNGPVTHYRAMMAFRGLVYEYADRMAFDGSVDEQSVRFKAKFISKKASRGLISDFHDILDPLAAVPLGAELVMDGEKTKDIVKKRLKHDLDKVRQACIEEMEMAKRVRVRASEFRKKEIPQLVRERVRVAISKYRFCQRHLNDIDDEELLSATLKCIYEDGLVQKSNGPAYAVHRAEKLIDLLFCEEREKFNSMRVIEIEHRACPEEVFAAHHLLQTYLGWNFSSVMCLSPARVRKTSSTTIEVQGYKSKTDDETPLVTLDLCDPGVEMALELLEWNHQQLRRLGYIKEGDDAPYWVVRPNRNSREADCKFHPQNRKDDFQRRNKLSPYTLDQTRTQVLKYISISAGGLEAARIAGGHTDIGVTDRYVRDEITERIASINNFNFSKKLAKEIVYIVEGGDRNSGDVTLLKPLGDGASCIDRKSPPIGNLMVDEQCAGRECHSSGGCPNRKVVVNEDRMEEVIRMNMHYKSSWQRYLSENPEKYTAYILPALIFNEALLLALKQGPYSHLLEAIKRRVYGEQN